MSSPHLSTFPTLGHYLFSKNDTFNTWPGDDQFLGNEWWALVVPASGPEPPEPPEHQDLVCSIHLNPGPSRHFHIRNWGHETRSSYLNNRLWDWRKALKGSRTFHPKIFHFPMLLILNQSYLRNSQCKEDTLTFLCPPESRRKSPLWKYPPWTRRREDSRICRDREFGAKKAV